MLSYVYVTLYLVVWTFKNKIVLYTLCDIIL